MDLDKAFADWKLGRMKYPELRRKSEDDFFGELVARIKALEAESVLEVAGWQVEPEKPADSMAAARAAKAAKRDTGAPADAA